MVPFQKLNAILGARGSAPFETFNAAGMLIALFTRKNYTKYVFITIATRFGWMLENHCIHIDACGRIVYILLMHPEPGCTMIEEGCA